MDFKSEFIRIRKLETYLFLERKITLSMITENEEGIQGERERKKDIEGEIERKGKNTLVVCCDGLILVLLYLVNLLHDVISIST